MAPPLTTSDEEIREGVKISDNAIAYCLGQGLPN